MSKIKNQKYADLKFDDQKLEEAGRDYSNLTDIPRKIVMVVDGVQAMLSQFLPIDPFPLKGFLFIAMKRTQERLEILATEFFTYPPEKKTLIIGVTFEILHELLENILKRTDDSISTLNEVMTEAEKFSISKLV